MSDSQNPAQRSKADLESKEIWGEEEDELDQEIMKVRMASTCSFLFQRYRQKSRDVWANAL